jgi:hypothetical protein
MIASAIATRFGPSAADAHECEKLGKIPQRMSMHPQHAHEAEPESVHRGKWATATWREGNMIYMLALEGTRD